MTNLSIPFKKLIVKILFSFLLLCPCLAGIAQDTSFYNKTGKKVTTKDSADFYSIIIRNREDTNRAKLISYYASGIKKSEVNYIYSNKKILDGLSSKWSENGNLSSESEYVNDKMHGTFKTYWDNGKLKRSDRYENDQFVSGNCFSSTGKDTSYFPYEQRPVYPGGTAEISKYVSNAIKYPADARRKEIQGRVMVQFSVNEEGKLGDFKVTQKVEPMLDEEALRVIKNMPDWQPGKIDGKPAKFLYALPVIFMLN
jgi:periplasmic protein TonB